MTNFTYSSTISAVMHDVARALNEADRFADLYSVLAPVVIAAYSDIDKEELGMIPGGEFGLCHGRVDGTDPKTPAETVDMFMAMAEKLKWATWTGYKAPGRKEIDLEALDMRVRLMPMGMSLQPAGYPQGEWRLHYATGASKMGTYSSPSDPDLVRVVEVLEEMDGIAALSQHTLNKIVELIVK